MKKERLIIAIILTAFMLASAISQEALLSTAENYYEFLALDGYVDRPYLNYRTLSDSVWTIKDELGDIWSGNNLGTVRSITDKVKFRVYGPDLYTSYNTAAPYGQNDGALWQGKGLNSSLTGGARVEGYGVELTLKPQVTFSQNQSFDLISSAYSNDSEYAGKGSIYGYYGDLYVDAPQRFGDSAFRTYSWGDSEIRYSWKTFTVGFGTQSIWLGPAKINPILHSNNAAPYPKVDLGFRRTPIVIPWVNWYAGDIEARLWAGYLSESEYFDNDTSNDHNLISGLSLAYAPSFAQGLTLFANRTFNAKWKPESCVYISDLFMVSVFNQDQVQGHEDQRGSLGFSYLQTRVGLEVYGEIGINDYVAGSTGYIRYPFHAMAYTLGLKKSFSLVPDKSLRGELTFECTSLEMSQDFQFQWASSFYAHAQITQGYTNGGQWLGAGIGTGGNSQYLGFKIYHPKGYYNIFIYRVNPDNDYVYAKSVQTVLGTTDAGDAFSSFKASLSLGLETQYFIQKSISLSGSALYDYILNPLYVKWTSMNNFHFSIGVSMYD